MSRVRFRPKADRDLMNIRRYTIERWGDAQAEDYVRSIAAVLESEAAGRRRSRRTDIAPELWRMKVGSHIAYYRRTDEYVDVLRIIHERMDAGRHLLRDA
ncbi:type II toxin-antitoxin system RelE/ParE family toxin [Salinarimonas sp. NSM]|uniref:type II toxin-antitoxin system RelE/ParE family toxin n=1 Tax=Salinarimonas sp. NSM TaxID=3458003 RepID=UPI0040355B60